MSIPSIRNPRSRATHLSLVGLCRFALDFDRLYENVKLAIDIVPGDLAVESPQDGPALLMMASSSTPICSEANW